MALLPIVLDIGNPKEMIVGIQRDLVGIAFEGDIVEEVFGDSQDFRFLDSILDQLFVEPFGYQLEHLLMRVPGNFGGSMELFIWFHFWVSDF